MTETPKTPEPFVTQDQDGMVRITPMTDITGYHPDGLREIQQDAIDLLDSLKEKVMSGHLTGLAVATVSYHEGQACVGTVWSTGAMSDGISTLAAINNLNRRFGNAWDMNSEEV